MTSGDRDSLERRLLCTDGVDCCHWCSVRPQAWVWGPYETRVCERCQQLAAEGRAAEVIDELAAHMTASAGPGLTMLDIERWRTHHLARMYRWLNVRTDCRPVRDDDAAGT